MANLLFGVDIGSKYTKVVVLEHGVKTRLVNGFLFPTQFKVGKDGDKQVDPELFIKAIGSFIPTESLRHAKIAVNLPPMSITALSVYLPLMSRKELSFTAINEAKQKMIPVSGPNHIFDCLFLGETMINKIPRAEVLVIRTEKFYVQRILDIFKSVEEFPVLISPASTILPNIVPKEAWKKDRAVVIVDIGASYLKISICSDAHMVFMRNIVFGLDDIIQDFSRQLSINAAGVEGIIKNHGIPDIPFEPKDKVAIAEEIMRQKYEASLASPTSSEAQVNLLELRLLWQPHIERIAQELRRSFVFYNERSEGRKIEQVFFTGGGSYIKNLRKILSSHVGGECLEVNPFAQIPHELSIDHKFKEEIASSAIFASAASLAFGIPLKKAAKQVQINFLPVELKQKEALAAKRMI
ncbi:MAG: pilus assembly protein PilM, partial [Candidatus Omnitrophica bacterium]|nr:pilus assembly protein PilM [Candidatus Omnitrophota bacterium]